MTGYYSSFSRWKVHRQDSHGRQFSTNVKIIVRRSMTSILRKLPVTRTKMSNVSLVTLASFVTVSKSKRQSQTPNNSYQQGKNSAHSTNTSGDLSTTDQLGTSSTCSVRFHQRLESRTGCVRSYGRESSGSS